jgi:hypothetical protein
LRGTWANGYEATLRQLATASGVPEARVVGHPPAPAGAMVRLAATCDVGLALEPGGTLNSQLAISNKLFTYLMAGLAVVASRTSGQQWALDRAPGAGWTYAPGDVTELASILSAHVLDRLARETARRAAAAAARSRFCWELEQDELLEEVDAVLERGVASRADAAAPLVAGGGGAA